MKRVAIYLRVSTSKQDTDNQRRELEAVAERSGWKVVKVYEDAGISGAKGRDQRPGLDAMMKAVNAKEFEMVASWSVDRLGRSLTDLLSILQSLHDKGVGLFLHRLKLDTFSLTVPTQASREGSNPVPLVPPACTRLRVL
jgi:DNA invertase Pin-like site-specific DNA recombinase